MKRTTIGLASGLSALVLIPVLLTAVAQANDRPPDNGASATPEKAAIAQRNAELARANAAKAADPETVRRIAAEKAVADQTHRAELAAHAEPRAPWPTGIFEDPEAPFSGSVFLGTNRWVGRVGDGYIVVYAGRSGQEPTTGWVFTQTSEGTSTFSRTITGSGPLRIVRAAGTTVTLVDQNGREYEFDAANTVWTPR